MKEEQIQKYLEKGVSLIDPFHTYIDDTVEVEEGTTIYPNVHLRGRTTIGKNNIIDMNTIIQDSKIGNENTIVQTVIIESEIGDKNHLGPFTHIRANTYLGNQNDIGSFVELKNTIIHDGNHIKHLAYCGNVTIQNHVNIGAGAVVANYNPKAKVKQNSTLEEHSCIGANAVIISPVTVGKNSQVAAGSVINQDVPEDSLAIARERQTIKENYYKESNI